MGPTAAGKTALALRLAEELPCSIISVDSGMVYRGMDIGTAKPTPAEQERAPHRLIDICDPGEPYSAARFRADALREIEAIVHAGRIPLLVGGTMLYFKVLQQGIAPLPAADSAVRAALSATAERHEDGWQRLHAKLQAIDPITAARLAPKDAQRIQRALEVYILTGRPLSAWHALGNAATATSAVAALPYHVINIMLMPTVRAALQDKIAQRTQLMLQQGLVAEVERLFKRGDLHRDLPALRAVGYRQVWQYLAGEISYNEMEELIVIATRQLAKRQLTWLRSWHAGDSNLVINSEEVIVTEVKEWIVDNS